MLVYNDLAEERIRIYDKGVATEEGGDRGLPPMHYRYGDVVSPFVGAQEPLAVQDGHFTDCVLDGVQPITDGAAGLAVVEVLEAAEISLARGRTVHLDEVRAPSLTSVPQQLRHDVIELPHDGHPSRAHGLAAQL
jgi:predicted dehydrogenase